MDFDAILQDLREGEDKFCGKKLEEDPDWSALNKRYDIYIDNHKAGRDADHYFQRVIQSYEQYEIFNNVNYTFKPGWFVYKNKNKQEEIEEIRLTGDLLTNVAAVEDWVIGHPCYCKDSLKNAHLNAFFRVSYTCGNFCPIWKNPTFGRGMDNVWQKLSTVFQKGKEWKSIEDREDMGEYNLRRRLCDNLFMILPIDNPKGVMESLYLVDYFDDNWQLRWEDEWNVSKMNEEVFDKYLVLTTKLIVQRCYRIQNNIQEKELSESAKKEIRCLFCKVGLSENDSSICQ